MYDRKLAFRTNSGGINVLCVHDYFDVNNFQSNLKIFAVIYNLFDDLFYLSWVFYPCKVLDPFYFAFDDG